jgi:RNA polymerase sigma-70 factor (ECF subfamily)
MLHHRPEAAVLSRDAIEAQAYGVAYVVARGLGVETHTAAAEYMASYAGDKKGIAQTLAVIQETSAQILDELLPESRAAVGRAAALDEKGFAQIHREYGDRLIRSLTGFVRDRDKAEDIAARAFQTAWEKRERFRGESKASSWIEAIARNEARQSYSQEQIARFDSIDGMETRELAAPELVTDELEKQDDRLRLQNALAQLSDKYRCALAAHFVDGLSIREIAHRDRVPLGTVLSRIFTGKQLLRQAWEAPLSAAQEEGAARRNPSSNLPERLASQAQEPSPRGRPDAPDLTWGR